MKLSDRQEQCLDVLAAESPDLAIYIRTIADRAELGERETRLAVRALSRKGLAELVRGLVDEDTGLLAGSGWRATRAGVNWAKDKGEA